MLARHGRKTGSGIYAHVNVSLHSRLSPFGLLSQNTTVWVACEQQKRIAHSSGGWMSKIKVPARHLLGREGPLLAAEDHALPGSFRGGTGQGVSLEPLL